MSGKKILPKNCKIFVHGLEENPCMEKLSLAVSMQKDPIIFGGNHSDSKLNQFSYFGFEPVEILDVSAGDRGVLDKLSDAINRYTLKKHQEEKGYRGHFYGGWAGFFSYDLKDAIEKIPALAKDDLKIPWIRLGFYDKLITYDHERNRWFLSVVQIEGEGKTIKQKYEELFDVIRKAQSHCEIREFRPIRPQTEYEDLDCNMTRQEYEAAMEKIQRYIYDGEVYQINFSQRFSCPFESPAIDLFLWQGRLNPSPFACYMDAGSYQVVSASPELFLRLDEGLLETRPIKGTRERVLHGEDAEEKNREHIADLLACEKEKAELNMIVDLERNDLTRVCRNGTIRVSEARHIEAYPTVFHAVAAIQGQLKDHFDGQAMCNILKGMFPGGSITGAPKIRAMEIIEELEPTQRGIYTGSMGYIGLGERIALNIAIRTIIIRDGRAYAQTGGGIVADSVTKLEWQETLTKARALVEGLRAIG